MAIPIIMIVMLGLLLMTGMIGWFDYLGKKVKSGGNADLLSRLAELERRLAAQEQVAFERDETVRKLQGEVSFMTNLLESRTR